jgi:hypothetical protein
MIPYPYQSLKLAREDSQHWWFHCVFHRGDNEPSMVVNKTEPYKLFFRCWACGENGNAKSFAVKYLGHDPKLIDSQIEPCSDAITILKERYKVNWETKRGCPLEHIPDEEQQLAFRVGISVETIRKFGIGWKDYKFLIPMYDEQGICGIAVRSYEFDNKKGWICKKRCIKGSKHGWFFPKSDYSADKPFFIAEGWSDTAVLIEMGFQAMGRFNAVHTEWNAMCSDNPNVYIISDTDECGIKGSKKLQQLIGGKIIYPPEYTPKCGFGTGPTRCHYKDIREFFLAVGPERCKQWLEKQL